MAQFLRRSSALRAGKLGKLETQMAAHCVGASSFAVAWKKGDEETAAEEAIYGSLFEDLLRGAPLLGKREVL